MRKGQRTGAMLNNFLGRGREARVEKSGEFFGAIWRCILVNKNKRFMGVWSSGDLFGALWRVSRSVQEMFVELSGTVDGTSLDP